MKRITPTFCKRLARVISVLAWLSLAGCSRLLFYPEPGEPFTPQVAGLAYSEVELRSADGVRLHGWWLPAKAGVQVKGTVLHLHGNGGNLSRHLGGSWWLPAAGYQVLLLDYRGYGRSEGTAELPGIYLDIQAALDWLRQAPPAQGKPLVLLGQSLGGALAIHYLAAHPAEADRFSAMVFDGAPASYRKVGRFALGTSWLTWPFQVPLSWLVPDSDSALTAAPHLGSVPKLVFQSLDDSVVPLENGIALYQALPPPRVLQLTRGAHVQTFADPTFRQVMLKFLEDPSHFNGLRRLGEVPNYP